MEPVSKNEAFKRQAEAAKKSIASTPAWLRDTAIPPIGHDSGQGVPETDPGTHWTPAAALVYIEARPGDAVETDGIIRSLATQLNGAHKVNEVLASTSRTQNDLIVALQARLGETQNALRQRDERLVEARYLLKRTEYIQDGAKLEGTDFPKHVCSCCGWPKGGHHGAGRIKGNRENTHEEWCSLNEVLHGRPAPRIADLAARAVLDETSQPKPLPPLDDEGVLWMAAIDHVPIEDRIEWVMKMKTLVRQVNEMRARKGTQP